MKSGINQKVFRLTLNVKVHDPADKGFYATHLSVKWASLVQMRRRHRTIMQGCLIGAWTGLPILEGNTVRLGEEHGRLRYGSTPYTLLAVLIDTANGGCFNCIVLDDIKEGDRIG